MALPAGPRLQHQIELRGAGGAGVKKWCFPPASNHSSRWWETTPTTTYRLSTDFRSTLPPVLDVPLISALEVFELVAIAALAGCTAFLFRRSMPATLESRQKRIEAISAELSSRVVEIVDERAVWKAQGERLAEEVSGYLDQIERKRRSTAASASRIQADTEPVEVSKLPRAQQIAMARRATS